MEEIENGNEQEIDQEQKQKEEQGQEACAASFDELGFRPELMRAVKKLGFTRPTPIQQRLAPLALAGRDIIGVAETGSGKTAAFLMPILHHLMDAKGFRCLVLEPTRELALQVKDVAVELGEFTGLSASAMFGGIPAWSQIGKFQAGTDILIATPGRLIDMAWQGIVDFQKVTHLVIDEVDRMFDMGFIEDIERIISFMPQRPYQKMLFSATLPPDVVKNITPHLDNPETVVIGRQAKPAEGITHELYPVSKKNKTEALTRLLNEKKVNSAIIFTETKLAADKLYKELKQSGFDVSPFHSGYDQIKRSDILRNFRRGRLKYLVATNVAARGLDISGITHIFNYDVPHCAEDYVHRIGRSARADATGIAVTLASSGEAQYVRQIEKLIQLKLPREKLAGLTMDDITGGGPDGGPGGGSGKPPGRGKPGSGGRNRPRGGGPKPGFKPGSGSSSGKKPHRRGNR